jgi:5'-deoxynucleotidase YfbR-like HD superfamily hydrolase
MNLKSKVEEPILSLKEKKDPEMAIRPDRNNLAATHRAAGKVKRFHTEHTIQTQTISDHVYNVFRLYFHLYGIPSTGVFIEIMYHDFEEVFIGDIPHWAASHPEIARVKKEQEFQIRQRFHISPSLTMEEELRVKFCDWIEALEFMLDESMFGNYTLRPGLEGLYQKLEMEAVSDRTGAGVRVIDYLEDTGFTKKYDLIIDGVHKP